MTALVLGGFFVFVCLLVLYKAKCKPMWKNRKRRPPPTNTPAATLSRADTAMAAAGDAERGGGACTQSLLHMQPVTVEINAPPPIIEHDEVEEEVCSMTLDLELPM